MVNSFGATKKAPYTDAPNRATTAAAPRSFAVILPPFMYFLTLMSFALNRSELFSQQVLYYHTNSQNPGGEGIPPLILPTDTPRKAIPPSKKSRRTRSERPASPTVAWDSPQTAQPWPLCWRSAAASAMATAAVEATTRAYAPAPKSQTVSYRSPKAPSYPGTAPTQAAAQLQAAARCTVPRKSAAAAAP